MRDGSRIDLAHADNFTLGRLTVRPSTREVVRDDGETDVLEPRVMQVLVALTRANGTIVSRDDLIDACWEGRIVGDDAINRVISRLRRTAEGIGEGHFRIETVTKVGYRIATGDTRPGAPAPTAAFPALPSRRSLMIGGAVVSAAAVAGGALWWGLGQPSKAVLSPEIAALNEQAGLALGQGTREGQNQAIALYKRVIALAPDYADGWGYLALVYANMSRFRTAQEAAILHQRSTAAARKALALEPDNVFGQIALASARPLLGRWWAVEQTLLRAAKAHPDNSVISWNIAEIMLAVGRCREGAAIYDVLASRQPPSPNQVYSHFRSVWAANRPEDADRLMGESAALYPTHFANWFGRFYIYIYSGRPAQAIAMAEDPDLRPTNISVEEIDRVVRVARAIQSRAPTEIDAVMREQFAVSRTGCGFAENALQFACVLGRVDDAFAIANAYYFAEGFVVPELRFTTIQGTYRAKNDRMTAFLFQPSTAPMRADPRFAVLTDRLGLKRYWQDSGSKPDYLQG